MEIRTGTRLLDINNKGWVFLEILTHPVTFEEFIRLQEIQEDLTLNGVHTVSSNTFYHYFMPVLEEEYLSKIMQLNCIYNLEVKDLNTLHPLER